MYLFPRAEPDGTLFGVRTNESTPFLPNPLTPMAFFPPDLAFELTIGSYITIAALAVMIWDILHTIQEDFFLLTRYTIRLPTIVYFLSRLSTFVFLLVLTIFDTAPFGACDSLTKATTWLCNIAVPSTSLLLFFRVQALYSKNRIVVGLFVLVWTGVCCVGVLSTINLSGTTIGPTRYCIDKSVPQDTYMFGVAVLANDTLTLLATSWRLRDITLRENSTFRENLRTIFIGSGLPNFSKSFLQDGQKYYLATAGFSIFATITLYLKAVPLPFRGVVGTVDIMLLNVMACRVFRNMKLGVYWEGPETIASRVVNEMVIRTTVAVTAANAVCEERPLQTSIMSKYQSSLA